MVSNIWIIFHFIYGISYMVFHFRSHFGSRLLGARSQAPRDRSPASSFLRCRAILNTFCPHPLLAVTRPRNVKNKVLPTGTTNMMENVGPCLRACSSFWLFRLRSTTAALRPRTNQSQCQGKLLLSRI